MEQHLGEVHGPLVTPGIAEDTLLDFRQKGSDFMRVLALLIFTAIAYGQTDSARWPNNKSRTLRINGAKRGSLRTL